MKKLKFLFSISFFLMVQLSFSQTLGQIERSENDECENVFFGAVPYPNDTSKYIGCIRGLGMILQCDQNQIFTPTINECTSKNACDGIQTG
jgi:hypothetical protein